MNARRARPLTKKRAVTVCGTAVGRITDRGIVAGRLRDQIDDEIGKTLIPMVKFIVLVFCGGILMAIFLTWRITRPIVRLVRTARRVSEGELDVPSLSVNDTDEFGELSRSFERMRSSVKAAMTRLDG